MILAHKSIKALSIDHPLGKDPSIPTKIEETRLIELVKKLRAGDRSVEDEIVRGHIRLAINIAGRYANLAPNKRDVLVCEAFYGIIYAIQHVNRLINTSITPWITSNIHRFVYDFISRDTTIYIPESSRYLDPNIKLKPFRQLNSSISEESKNTNELMELINKAALTEENRYIIALRIQGYNDEEIGGKINKSNSYVNYRRKEIEKRFRKLQKELDND